MSVTPDLLLVVPLFVLGLLIGSFLNVVIHRVPAGRSIVSPGSACPVCGSGVRTRDNLPVVSWLLLRGRCRDCDAPIPWRYPAVELVTGALFVAAGLRFGWTPYLGTALVLAAAGTALFVIDIDHRRLPFAITRVTAAAVLLTLGVATVLTGTAPLLTAALSGVLWVAVYGGIWLVTAGRGMGLGDVALAPVLGVALGWLGWGASLVGLMGGFLIGATIGAALLISGTAERRAQVPHGPFLLAGVATGMLLGQPLWEAYLRLVGVS
jgi:leader peptidase (prepilin peptidase)/N-methyltransferase